MTSSIHAEDAAAGDAAAAGVETPGRRGGSKRLRGLAVLTPCAALIAAAASLAPRGSGYGTHTQLGLPPCSFKVNTGLPCPSCGMTTSMAAMAHGQIADAFAAQPFGVLLFIFVVMLGGFGAAEAATGRNLLRVLRPGLWWVGVLVVGLLAGWGIRLALGAASGKYSL